MDKHSNKVTFCKLSRFFRILFIDFSGFYSSIFPVFIHRFFRILFIDFSGFYSSVFPVFIHRNFRSKKRKPSTNHVNNAILHA